MIKVANGFTSRSDNQIGLMAKELIGSEIQSKRKNLVLPQWSCQLLSGYFSLLEKLISSSCLPQNLKQMKRQTIYLSDSNSQLNWNMKGGNETDLYPLLLVCRSFLKAPFVP